MPASETFEQKMGALKKQSPEDYSKRISEINKTCKEYCGGCPSYVGTGEKDLVFCITGKSKTIKEENGCLCAACPVSGDLSLKWEYYCTRGSGTQQAIKQKK